MFDICQILLLVLSNFMFDLCPILLLILPDFIFNDFEQFEKHPIMLHDCRHRLPQTLRLGSPRALQAPPADPFGIGA